MAKEKRYQIDAEMTDGSLVTYGGEYGYQNLFVADGAAKMLLGLNADVVRVFFRCLDA